MDYLYQTISSARLFGDIFLIVVAPEDSLENFRGIQGIDLLVPEVEHGLASAINLGFKCMPKDIKYVTWIGDDDLLEKDSGKQSVDFLEKNPEYVMTFGECAYIDSKGALIGKNHSGQWAVNLLRFGPDLIPQPGSVFRRSSFNTIGHLDDSYAFAFDFDLFIRLSKIGRLKHLGIPVGSFRWHNGSKTVANRRYSVMEASRVRRRHLPLCVRGLSLIWEIPVVAFTFVAGSMVDRRAKNLTDRG